jgi:YnbE-like lipoprotein
VTRSLVVAATIWLMAPLAACEPVIRVKVSDEPIVINLNVNINQEIRIKLDREAEELFEEREDIF